jgi:hypothetical protein
MQKKITTKIVLLVVSFLAVSTFFACVEEPFIEPVVIPYSVLRVGNLTENLDDLRISIDGEYPVPALQNLEMNSFTEYFDLVAGRRYFVITQPSTGDTLFEKWLDVLSYEQQTMWYAGYYHPSIDTSTANFFIYSDAFTYLSKDPPAGEFKIFFIHSSPDTPTDSTRSYDLVARYNVVEGSDTTEVSETIVNGILFGEVRGGVLAADNYSLDIVREIDSEVLYTYTGSFTDGLWSWLYIVGEPSTPSLVREDHAPTPARPK